MADRADAADAAGDSGHFAQRPAFAEFFKAAELGDVKARVHDAALVIQLDGNFGMALDAGYGVDDNSLCHNKSLYRFNQT